MQPQLKFSCPEKWNSMSAGKDGRYCDKCEKVVKDFSRMNNQEIVNEISLLKTENSCGNFKAYQLNEPFNDRRNSLIGFYHRISSGKRNFMRASQLGLAVILLFITGCYRRMSGMYAMPSHRQMKKYEKQQLKSDSTHSKKSTRATF
jgi:hypothetical protein